MQTNGIPPALMILMIFSRSTFTIFLQEQSAVTCAVRYCSIFLPFAASDAEVAGCVVGANETLWATHFGESRQRE